MLWCLAFLFSFHSMIQCVLGKINVNPHVMGYGAGKRSSSIYIMIRVDTGWSVVKHLTTENEKNHRTRELLPIRSVRPIITILDQIALTIFQKFSKVLISNCTLCVFSTLVYSVQGSPLQNEILKVPPYSYQLQKLQNVQVHGNISWRKIKRKLQWEEEEKNLKKKCTHVNDRV